MNSKKLLTGVLSIVGICGLGIAGWFAFETYNGNENPGSSIISKLSARNVDFNEAYNVMVDSYSKDYVEMVNKMKDYKNIQENITINGNGDYEQMSGNINMNLSGIYSNQGELSQNKALFDILLDGNFSFPSFAGGTGVESVSFSGGLGFEMIEGKLLGILKSLNLNSTNPQIAMVNGFISAYQNQWIILSDYNSLSGTETSFNFKTNEIYDLINRFVEDLKKYPVISQTGDVRTEGDWQVYAIDLNKQNVTDLYKDILSSPLFSSMTGVSQQELQQSVTELSGAMAGVNGIGTMKVKDSENIIIELSGVTLDQNVVMSGILSKINGKSGIEINVVNPSQPGSNVKIKFEGNNGIDGNIEMYENGTKVGTIEMSMKINPNSNGMDSSFDISGNVFGANFKFKLTENLKSIAEIQSGAIVMPTGAVDINSLMNF